MIGKKRVLKRGKLLKSGGGVVEAGGVEPPSHPWQQGFPVGCLAGAHFKEPLSGYPGIEEMSRRHHDTIRNRTKSLNPPRRPLCRQDSRQEAMERPYIFG